MRIRLPKQWRRWCQKAGLRPHYGGRRRYEWLYLKGHGRVWRINCNDALECGDTYAEFDRWALCDREEVPRPTSEAQFVAAVRCLLGMQRAKTS